MKTSRCEKWLYALIALLIAALAFWVAANVPMIR
jgi:hypothetical protein